MSVSCKRVIRCATLLALGGSMACGVAAASATVVDREHFQGSETVPDEICGISVIRDSEFSGSLRIRAGTGATDQAFFERVNFRYSDTFTNPENGKSLTIQGHSVYNEVKAERVEGNVFEFTTIEAGQPFVLTDSSGRVILRDRGLVRSLVLFDTLGDSMPGGQTLDVSTIRVSGPHPAFDLTDEEFCGVVESLIG